MLVMKHNYSSCEETVACLALRVFKKKLKKCFSISLYLGKPAFSRMIDLLGFAVLKWQESLQFFLFRSYFLFWNV